MQTLNLRTTPLHVLPVVAAVGFIGDAVTMTTELLRRRAERETLALARLQSRERQCRSDGLGTKTSLTMKASA